MTDIQRSSGPLPTPPVEEDLPPQDDNAADVRGGKGGSCDRDDDRGDRKSKGGKGRERMDRRALQQQAGSSALAQANQTPQNVLGLLR